MEIINQTVMTEFVLKGFSGGLTIHIVLFVTLFLVYLVTLAGNIFMIVLLCCDSHLHSPMYFFLVCLSFLEVCGISTVTPKLLAILIVKQGHIYTNECFTQSFFYFFISSSDFLLLSIMSFDRFVAICYPLQYTIIMKNSLCIKLVVGCFIISFSCLLYPTLIIPKLPFCGHILDHFFCEGAAMMKLICADTRLLKLNTIISSVFILIGPLIVTTISYILIVSVVIRIPSDTGRRKTFSTCMSHLTMVSIVFGSAIFIEIRPSKNYSTETDKKVNLVSTVLGPLLNPFVYTLRNEKVKNSIRDAIRLNRKLL